MLKTLTAPTKRMIARIEKLKTEIGKKRDELRELTSELEQIGDDCSDAIGLMSDAADALSRLV